MSQTASQSGQSLYPPLETELPPLSTHPKYCELVRIEKELVAHLNNVVGSQLDPLEDVADKSILPSELITTAKKAPKPKIDPLTRIKALPTEEAEEEEENTEDEENEDEEAVADEEDDAGGDYLVSHFDNGEGFEDNDEDGDDMTSMM